MDNTQGTEENNNGGVKKVFNGIYEIFEEEKMQRFFFGDIKKFHFITTCGELSDFYCLIFSNAPINAANCYIKAYRPICLHSSFLLENAKM